MLACHVAGGWGGSTILSYFLLLKPGFWATWVQVKMKGLGADTRKFLYDFGF